MTIPSTGYSASRFEIPWHPPETWREIHESLDHLITRRRAHLRAATEHARRVEAALRSAFPLMEALCAETCPTCAEPCCVVATLWYNFQDVIFLNLAGRTIPPGQPMAAYGGICRYLGETGCTLPRIERPWICTWYVCPDQTAILRSRMKQERMALESCIAEIKAQRKAMEAAFLEAIS